MNSMARRIEGCVGQHAGGINVTAGGRCGSRLYVRTCFHGLGVTVWVQIVLNHLKYSGNHGRS
jgi:hypothetical protein